MYSRNIGLRFNRLGARLFGDGKFSFSSSEYDDGGLEGTVCGDEGMGDDCLCDSAGLDDRALVGIGRKKSLIERFFGFGGNNASLFEGEAA